MNSVIEASDTIHFIHEGEIAFKGDNAEMMVSDSETLNDFIYASKLMRKLRDKAK
jgi:ABC-type transporter Mla maintaining outer membrane lipid asymmetry ATPase subunit MlaF